MVTNSLSSSSSSGAIFWRDIPRLDGINYTIWKIQMETHLRSLGNEIWEITQNVVTPYNLASGNPPLEKLDKEIENYCREREALLCAHSDYQIMRLIDKSSGNATWDKLETLNEGDPIVKIGKLDGYQVGYENLKMEEDERITAFMEMVNKIVMGIQCCSGTLTEDEIVSKILRALPSTYKMKATTINELRTMANTSVNGDTLVGKLSDFELEEFGPSRVLKTEPSFHASTSATSKKDWEALYTKKLEDMKREDDEFEKLEALFATRVPKGLVGSKYERKALFKCFACNKNGHFASRCPERNSIFEERVR